MKKLLFLSMLIGINVQCHATNIETDKEKTETSSSIYKEKEKEFSVNVGEVGVTYKVTRKSKSDGGSANSDNDGWGCSIL